jgi:hypothetical protein
MMNTTVTNEFFSDSEELEMTLDCAWKIRSHISRLVTQESKVKYVNNLNILDSMIGSYNEQLEPAFAG